ncbi:hypothetical protein KSS87_008586 [Heliosperma pusillum]|nr:hypothetical protein KSS87_008586 [Heliosperma pusillum]
MSAYENVVGGKLKLKGKALDVKSSGMKKKKKQKKLYEDVSERKEEKVEGVDAESSIVDGEEEDTNESDKLGGEGKAGNFGDHLTPAEKRYIEQREKLDAQKYEKTSKKSHRDRLDDFNQYLADLSEHYDIPKVGPG